jgi:putative methyltransferase
MGRKSERLQNSLYTETINSAAPGNKTSFISALMGNRGKVGACLVRSNLLVHHALQVHAFERSHQRYKTLQKMLDRAGCKNVEARRGDFLESKPEDFANVTRMYVNVNSLLGARY